MKTALVTGGTSGIGLCAARELAAAGYTVYTFSRRGAGPAGMTHLAVDVTDEEAVQQAVAKIISETDRLDLVLHWYIAVAAIVLLILKQWLPIPGWIPLLIAAVWLLRALVVQLLGGDLLNQLAFGDDAVLCGNQSKLCQNMGGNQEGNAALPVQPQDQLSDLYNTRRIQAVHRLVQDQELRPA